jgi:hypothetical protein
MFFYLYALYLQANACLYLASAVHIIFDLNVYYMLLDVIALFGYNQDEFRFTLANKERLKSKIIFNFTLIAISYISQAHFITVFSGLFMYIHGFFLFIRCLQTFKGEKVPLQSAAKKTNNK